MARTTPYIRRDGDCRQMLEFYRSCFGGKLDVTLVRDTPAAKEMPEALHHRVMHATLSSDVATLAGSDLPDTAGHRPGNDWALVIDCSSEAELRELFEKLAAGATVQRRPESQFWGGIFAQLTDKFDVDWMLNFQPPAPAS